MEQENLKQLNKLARLLNADRVITPDEIEQVLVGILSVMNSFKSDNEKLTKEATSAVNVLLERVLDETQKLSNKIDDKLSKTSEKLSSSITKKAETLDARIKEVQSKIEEVKAIEVKDGKDADEEMIIDTVLSKIKLPEYKETVLDDGEEIVAKINELSTTEDAFKIDASHIKNLPIGRGVGGSTARNLYQLQDVSITNPQNGDRIIYNSTTGLWENGVDAGGSLTGANNGLSVLSGTTVQLGGNLTKDTTISGDSNTYDLSITDLDAFTTSYVSSSSTRTSGAFTMSQTSNASLPISSALFGTTVDGYEMFMSDLANGILAGASYFIDPNNSNSLGAITVLNDDTLGYVITSVFLDNGNGAFAYSLNSQNASNMAQVICDAGDKTEIEFQDGGLSSSASVVTGSTNSYIRYGVGTIVSKITTDGTSIFSNFSDSSTGLSSSTSLSSSSAMFSFQATSLSPIENAGLNSNGFYFSSGGNNYALFDVTNGVYGIGALAGTGNENTFVVNDNTGITTANVSTSFVVTDKDTGDSIFSADVTNWLVKVGNPSKTYIYVDDLNTAIEFNGGVKYKYRSVSTSGNILATDYTVDVDTASVTMTLPDASTVYRQVFVIKNTSGGTITVDTTSSQTIYLPTPDGAVTSVSLLDGESLTVQSDGSNYIAL